HDGGTPPVHDDARRGEAELGDDHLVRARQLPRASRHARGVPDAGRAQGLSRRLPWARIGGALAALVATAVFATGHAVMLGLLVAWHAALIALPMAAVVLACLRAGLRDATVLALCGLAGGGLGAFVLFWIWWASPTGGALASVAWIAASAAIVGSLLARLDRDAIAHAAPLGMATLMWVS